MPRLYLLSGDTIGATHDFESGAVLGRGKAADVVLGAPSVSRQHARVELRGEEWWVVDLGSSNGTRVGDRRVSEALLEDGALLVLGDLELRFRAIPPEGEAAPKVRPSPPEDERMAETTFAPRAQVDLGSTGDTGEIVLEGEWDEVLPDFVPTRSAPPVSTAPATPAAPRRGTRDREDGRVKALGGASPSGGRATASGGRVLQYHKVENTGGLLGAELSQQPTLVRWLLYLLALAFFAGLTWGAYRLTGAARHNASMIRDVEQ